MSDLKTQIKKLAELMEEFNLLEAELSGKDWQVGFSKLEKQVASTLIQTQEEALGVNGTSPYLIEQETSHDALEKEELGTPVESPIMGIFYTVPSPNAPPYIHAGDHVEEGQIIGLVESMKVFNEITAPSEGIASEYKIKHGELVHQGDILLYLLPGSKAE